MFATKLKYNALTVEDRYTGNVGTLDNQQGAGGFLQCANGQLTAMRLLAGRPNRENEQALTYLAGGGETMVFGYACGDDQEVVKQLQELVNHGIDCFVYDLIEYHEDARPRLEKLTCRLQPGDTLKVVRGNVIDELANLCIDYMTRLVEVFKVNVEILSYGRLSNSPIGLLMFDRMKDRTTFEVALDEWFSDPCR